MDSIKIEYNFIAPDRTVPYEYVGRFVAHLQAEYPEQVISLIHDVKMDCMIDDLVAPLIFLHENGFITFDISASTVYAHKEVLPQSRIRPVLPKRQPVRD
jgi:hypothetical protein